MSAERPKSGIRQPVEGVDYLTDHYRVLGVSSDASPKEITTIFKQRIRDAHPDTYSGNDPVIKNQLAFKTRVLANAYETLADPDARQQFDEQLAGWKGPISEDGVPISTWRSIVRGSRESLDPLLEHARMMSGFDPDTFALLEEQYQASENPSQALKNAYGQALLRRDLYLSQQEGILRESVSIEPESPFGVPKNYTAIAASRLDTARERLHDEINEISAMLESGGSIGMIEAGLEQAPGELKPESAISLYREQMTEQFEAFAEEIAGLAGEREDVIRKRLDLLTGDYILKQDTLHNKLLIGVKIPGDADNIFWTETAFEKIQDDQLTALPADTVSDEVKAGLAEETNAQALIDQGYNLVVFPLQEGLSVEDQMNEIMLKHGEAYLDQQGTRTKRSDA